MKLSIELLAEESVLTDIETISSDCLDHHIHVNMIKNLFIVMAGWSRLKHEMRKELPWYCASCTKLNVLEGDSLVVTAVYPGNTGSVLT